MAAWQADHDHIENFSLLVVACPCASRDGSPALVRQLCGARVSCCRHVCTIMGYEEYFPIAERYKVPIVVTGFEPLDILDGILMTVSQLEDGRHEVENQYARATRREGNRPAQERIVEVFEVVNRQWRGLGEIPVERLSTARPLSETLMPTAAFRSPARRRTNRRSASAD